MIPPTRIRERPALHLFSPLIPPNFLHARLDKLRVVFPNHSVDYSGEDALRAYIRRLAPSPGDRQQGPMIFSLGRTGYDLTIRDGWLFGGTVKIGRPRGAGPGRSTMRIDLMLNPSRFFAHLSPETLAEWGSPEELLRAREERRTAASTFTLDGSDNVLSPEMVKAARPFLRQTMRYVQLVTALIRDRLRAVSDPLPLPNAVGAAVRYDQWDGEIDLGAHGYQDFDCRFNLNWTGWQVAHTEVYWEYRAPDALALTHRLATRLHAAADEATTDAYDVPGPRPPRQPGQARWRTRRNAISTKVELGAEGVELIAYAKEFDRLRLEVRYKRNLRQALGRSGRAGERPARPLQGPRPRDAAATAPLLALRPLLRTAAEDAAARLARVLAALADMEAEGAPSLDGVADLFGHVFAAVSGDQGRARRLLSLLVHNLAISEAGLNDLTGPVRTLRTRGVLVDTRVEQRRAFRRYRLAAQYRRVADTLRNAVVPP